MQVRAHARRPVCAQASACLRRLAAQATPAHGAGEGTPPLADKCPPPASSSSSPSSSSSSQVIRSFGKGREMRDREGVREEPRPGVPAAPRLSRPHRPFQAPPPPDQCVPARQGQAVSGVRGMGNRGRLSVCCSHGHRVVEAGNAGSRGRRVRTWSSLGAAVYGSGRSTGKGSAAALGLLRASTGSGEPGSRDERGRERKEKFGFGP